MRRPGESLPTSWTVHREVVLLAGWARAILMQLAHPLIARGVADHSAFERERFGRWRRLHRTLGAMLTLTFGTEDEIRATLERINGIHRRVAGALPTPVGPFPGGAPYRASDPDLLRWVHVTCVDSFMLTYETFVRPLTAAERDAYCAESAGYEVAIGIPPGALPRRAAELGGYIERMLAGEDLVVSDTARRLAREIMHPPLGSLAWPVAALMRLTTIGFLPASLRQQYGFRWTPAREHTVRTAAAAVRSLLPLVPWSIRQWPLARRAIRREAGIIRPHAATSQPSGGGPA